MWIRTLNGLTFYSGTIEQGTLIPTAEDALNRFLDELDREDAHRRICTAFQIEETNREDRQ